jgi:hypothetical protein
MMKAKIRILDNGDEITADQLALKLGISLNNARNRLTRSTDPAQVYAPKKGNNKECNESYKMRRIHSRGMFDEMLVLAMKSI